MLASARSAFTGHAVAARPAVAFAPRRSVVVIESAHKKGAGSTKNGRDSNAKRRGVKVYGGQEVKAGGIIIRQVGSQWYAGDNCGTGKDFTIFSTVDGIVVFDKKKASPKIHVYPMDAPKAVAAVTATHTTKPKEGVPSRQERRKALYKTRRTGSTVAVATVAASVAP